MSDAHGTLRYIGSADKQENEKQSITIIRTGINNGTTGPKIFLLKGTKKRKGFTNEFLEKHGLASLSTIVMTEKAYMTSDAWLEVTKAVVKGYRSPRNVKDNPEL